ncbi:uroporphyrinogen-III synthase [Ignicoccus islandicus]|uniref:uroporphyrinogen-III synthase n=1 Tax=Ignicoccus islandicus TaxID=54259 RepID=UPI0009465A68|nr:uroporphyrinogen-III synthase [Ignicoccus islandicus]
MGEETGTKRCRGKVLTFRPRGAPELDPFDVINVPLLQLVPTLKPEELEESIKRAEAVVFTSVTGVEVVKEKVPSVFNLIKGKNVIAIGPKTAQALREVGLEAIVPKEFTSEGLVELLRNYNSIVAVRSSKGSKELRERLGNKLKEVIAYETLRLKRKEVAELLNEVDAVVVSSAEIARALIESLEEAGVDPSKALSETEIVVIGPFAAKPLEELGIRFHLAEEATFEGVKRKLIEILCNK